SPGGESQRPQRGSSGEGELARVGNGLQRCETDSQARERARAETDGEGIDAREIASAQIDERAGKNLSCLLGRRVQGLRNHAPIRIDESAARPARGGIEGEDQ